MRIKQISSQYGNLFKFKPDIYPRPSKAGYLLFLKQIKCISTHVTLKLNNVHVETAPVEAFLRLTKIAYLHTTKKRPGMPGTTDIVAF